MTEQEFRTGEGPAFEASRQAAAVVKAGVGGFDFISEAMVTLSPQYHGELVAHGVFMIALDNAIKSLGHLDKVKKTLFYGRDNGLIREGEMPSHRLPNLIEHGNLSASFPTLTREQAINFIHGALGYATESGEMLEALRKAIEGQGVDNVNVMEESGDGKWYLAILAHTFGYGWTDDEQTIIAKLRQRFPDKFTEFDAINRNLAGERAVLETHLPIGERQVRMQGENNQDGEALHGQVPTRTGPIGDIEGMHC